MKREKLEHIAPKLYQLKKAGSGFEIPEGYFESVENLVGYLSVANDLPANDLNEFSIPDSYFESFEDVVTARLKAESMNKNAEFELAQDYFDSLEDRVVLRLKKSRSIFKKRVLRKIAAPIAIAASFLLLFSIFNNSPLGIDDLDTSDLEDWITSESYLETEQLLVVFENTDLDDISLSNSVSNEAILDYLEHEQLDEFLYDN